MKNIVSPNNGLMFDCRSATEFHHNVTYVHVWWNAWLDIPAVAVASQ